MATNCFNSGEQVVRSQMPTASDYDSKSKLAPPDSPTTRILNIDAAAREEAAAHARAVDEVQNAMPTDPTPAPDMDAGTQAGIGQAARRLQKLARISRDAEARELERMDEIFTAVNGTNVRQGNWWLNLANGLYRRFQDAAAPLFKFGQLYAGSEGRSINDNVIVSSYTKAQRETAGFNQQFLGWMRELVDDPINRLARSVGKDPADLKSMVGIYATARHAPERNAELLRRWEIERDAEQLMEKPDQRLINELTQDIENLRKYKDATEELPDGLVTSGYTDGQAELQMATIAKETGLTRQQLDQLSDGLTAVYQRVQDFRAEHGLLSDAESFPEFQHFVPMKLEKDLASGALNSTFIFRPQKFYKFGGMTGQPASAYLSILNYMGRTAREVATRDLGTTLVGVAQKSFGKDIRYSDIPINTKEAAPNGMRLWDMDMLDAQMAGERREAARKAHAIVESRLGGGLVVEIPRISRETGEITGKKRVFVQWESDWKDEKSGLNGAMLNQALTKVVRQGDDLAALARATGFVGQFYTRLNPLFAPVNTIRDFIERGSNLMGMELFGEDGSRIKGHTLLGRYLAATGEADLILRQVKNGTLQEGSPAWQMWNDYVQDGLHQEYTRGVNVNRIGARDVLSKELKLKGTPSWKILNDPKYAGVKKSVQALGEQGTKALEVLDNKWNDRFNNIAPLAEYIAMRKAGVERNSAANAVVSQMNLYQSGTWTRYMQCLFPFIKPSMQSFTAAMRTIGSTDASGQFRLNKRGIAGVLGMTAAYMALSEASRASLGTDPTTGIDRFDQMSIDELQRGLPIGIGDGTSFLRFPTGYGLIQPIIAMTVGFDRNRRGIGSIEETAFDTIFSMVKNAMPANWPEFKASDHPIEWITQAFTPTLAQPIVGAGIRRLDRYGRPISYADPNSPKALAEQGGLSTPKFYHDIAKDILKYTNVDLAPEQVRALSRGVFIGPLRIMTSIMEDSPVARAARSESASKTLGPFLTSMGASLLYGNTYDTGKAMFYNAMEAYTNRIRKSGVEVVSSSYGNDRAKKEAFLREQLPKAGFDPEEVEDYILIDRTMADIRKYNRTSSDTLKPLWQSGENADALKTGLKEYAETAGAMYDEAVNGLSFYRGYRQ